MFRGAAAFRVQVCTPDEEAVAQAIRTSRAGLTDPRKPIGVFMMVGTSGAGKTETALALADQLRADHPHARVVLVSAHTRETLGALLKYQDDMQKVNSGNTLSKLIHKVLGS